MVYLEQAMLLEGSEAGPAFFQLHQPFLLKSRVLIQQLRGRAGFHYCTTLLHRVQMALKLETDPSRDPQRAHLLVPQGAFRAVRPVLHMVGCLCCKLP